MNREELFEIWAPRQSLWSPWAKAVVFASCHKTDTLPPPATFDPIILPPTLDRQTAVVVDLPGPKSVAFGVELARKQFRPVPLFNALPAPFNPVLPNPPDYLGDVIDVRSTMAELLAKATELAAIAIPPDAPPAFLLDSRRRGLGATPQPAQFDNRSISFPTDFPSATFLRDHGISRAVMIRETGFAPQEDLAHALLRWQSTGIAIYCATLDSPSESPRLIEVTKPRFFGIFWRSMMAGLKLRRSPLGGFGGKVPFPQDWSNSG